MAMTQAQTETLSEATARLEKNMVLLKSRVNGHCPDVVEMIEQDVNIIRPVVRELSGHKHFNFSIPEALIKAAILAVLVFMFVWSVAVRAQTSNADLRQRWHDYQQQFGSVEVTNAIQEQKIQQLQGALADVKAEAKEKAERIARLELEAEHLRGMGGMLSGIMLFLQAVQFLLPMVKRKAAIKP